MTKRVKGFAGDGINSEREAADAAREIVAIDGKLEQLRKASSFERDRRKEIAAQLEEWLKETYEGEHPTVELGTPRRRMEIGWTKRRENTPYRELCAKRYTADEIAEIQASLAFKWTLAVHKLWRDSAK